MHLKPLEQDGNGRSKIKVSRKALTYLYKNLKLISSPFDIGVYWTDTLLNKEVAFWSLEVAKNFVGFLFNVSYTPPFGNHLLDFHLMRLKMGKWRKD